MTRHRVQQPAAPPGESPAAGATAAHPDIQIVSHSQRHRRHHVERGYVNIWGGEEDTPFWRVLTWLVSRAIKRKDNIPAPAVPADLEAIHRETGDLQITWIGHASFLVQMDGLNILLDPVFSHRASPLSFAGPRREPPLPIEIRYLPPIDVVITSHDHYDHLDRRAIRALEEHSRPTFLAPLGVGNILRSFGGTRVYELDWWQFTEIGGLEISCLPARHFSGRGLHNRNGTLWSSWYLRGDDLRLYFAADSAYASHFREIGETLGAPDVALMPIGAYRPGWIMEPVHVSPEQALQAFSDLGAEYFVPTHWGTFDLADEPIQEPVELLEQLASQRRIRDRIVRFAIGETRTFASDGWLDQDASARSASS